ncbi:MAG: CPBP family intramembrane metalloprotease [Spirochaetales bacterium]|nr:CPBP family intramembrane metalloprotease [Spirochaetales bacterium]
MSRNEATVDLGLAFLLALVFSLPESAGGGGIPDWGGAAVHLRNIGFLAPQALLFLMIIDMRLGGSALESPRGFLRELPGTLLLAGLLTGAGLAVPLVLPAGASAPALAAGQASAVPLHPWLLLPLIALSALSVGWREEALFRVLVPGLLERGGTPKALALAAPLALFALAHLWQGVQGAVSALVLGGILAAARARGSPLRRLALAHAAYDALAMTLLAYGA